MDDTTGFSLESADDGAVRWLTLSNPGRLNAIPTLGFDMLADAIDAFESSTQRVLVLIGAGGNFCSGAEVTDVQIKGNTAAENMKVMAGPARAAAALHNVTKPTVAAVDGVAVGAGMNLALGCDIVYATERARFAEIFVRRGLALDFGGTWLLPRLVGLARARELALTGCEVDAEGALADGMVARVVPSERLTAEVAALAVELAEGAPLAQQFIKSAMSRSSALTFEQALRFEDQIQAVLLTTDDVAEAIDAFVSKRSPLFHGR